MVIHSFRDLEAWQVGVQVVEEVYALTCLMPRTERYGLVAQMRRAAVGIPSNVAEGHQQGTRKAYAHFVTIALGCEAEIHTHLELVRRLQMAPDSEIERVRILASRLGQILRGLQRSLRR